MPYYGALTAGALGISNNIGGLTTNWHAGMLDGASSVISQNRGAGKYKRTIQVYYWLVFFDVMIGLIGLAAVNAGLPWLAQVFAQSKNNFDSEFCQMIIDIHRWEMKSFQVFLFRIPVLWYLQNYTMMGSEAVGVTMMVSTLFFCRLL